MKNSLRQTSRPSGALTIATLQGERSRSKACSAACGVAPGTNYSVAHEPEGGWLVRYSALDLMLNLWAKEQTEDTEHGRDAAKVKGKAADELPWLKILLLQLSAPQEKDLSIRMKSLWALCNVWEREPWLKAVLLPLATPAVENEPVREMALFQLKKF